MYSIDRPLSPRMLSAASVQTNQRPHRALRRQLARCVPAESEDASVPVHGSPLGCSPAHFVHFKPTDGRDGRRVSGSEGEEEEEGEDDGRQENAVQMSESEGRSRCCLHALICIRRYKCVCVCVLFCVREVNNPL